VASIALPLWQFFEHQMKFHSGLFSKASKMLMMAGRMKRRDENPNGKV